MSTLSPRPTPVAVTPDNRPGGVDALERDPDGKGLGRDLPPELGATAKDVPASVKAPDRKSQAPSGHPDADAFTTPV